MLSGTVKKLKVDQGYGFILSAEGGNDVFFHHSVVKGDFEQLRDGDTVEFSLDEMPQRQDKDSKGPRADCVKRTGDFV